MISKFAVALVSFSTVVFSDQAVGVNQTSEEGFGARYSGMAATQIGLQGDANSVAGAPAAMNDVEDLTFSLSHSEKFGTAAYDNLAIIVPFEQYSTVGVGLSRFGVSGIERHIEGQAKTFEHNEHFAVSDYLLVLGFARRWGNLDAGANLHLLYRDLYDQTGWGTRGDFMAQYTMLNMFRLGALVKGLLPSSAKWEQNDYFEYESSDIHLGAGIKIPSDYFYGVLNVALQTDGLFQKKGKSQSDLKGGRVHASPMEILQTTNLGMEYAFNFGLNLRFGLDEIELSKFPFLPSLGVGYSWKRIVTVDYSFTPHPELLSTQRVALQITPVFAGWNGLGYRSRSGSHSLPKGSRTVPVRASNPHNPEIPANIPSHPTEDGPEKIEGLSSPESTEGETKPDSQDEGGEVLEEMLE